MAEDLIAPEQSESQSDSQSEATPARPRIVLDDESPKLFKGRFRFVYLILILGIAGAIAGAVIISSEKSSSSARHSSAQEGVWSTWTPTGATDHSNMHQIASKVTSDYNSLGDSVHVLSVDPLQLHPPIAAFEAFWDTGVLNQPRHSSAELTNNSWIYEICGPGASCGLANTGGESPLKFEHRLFQGMLELSLYTFHYVPRIQSVVVLLPPNGPNSFALYVKRASVAPLLRLPLRKAIGKPGSPRKLDSRFRSHLYQWSQHTIQQLPDMSLLLGLNKVEGSGIFGG